MYIASLFVKTQQNKLVRQHINILLVYIIFPATCFGSDRSIIREIQFMGLYMIYIFNRECSSFIHRVQNIVQLDTHWPV